MGNVRRTGRLVIIGTGFLAITMVWQIYTAYMPLYYNDLVGYGSITGLIIGLDNLLGKLVQPWIGAWSDGYQSPLGRRVPFLLVGAPIAALLLGLIPTAVHWGLVPLVVVASAMNLAMAVIQSPTVALMPDVTPSQFRSSANGVISLMGGVGAVVAYALGGPLYRLDSHYPFWMVAGTLLVVTGIWATLVRERRWSLALPATEPEERPGFGASLVAAGRATWELLRSRDVSALSLFLAIFCWSAGYQAVETWFTTFATRGLGMDRSAAVLSLAFAAGALVLTAVPAGLLGRYLGRRRTIRIGLIGLVVMLVAISFAHSVGMVRLLLALVGVSWSLVTINAYPMVVDLVTEEQTGVYTGLYYIFSGVPTLVGPLLFGILIDVFGDGAMFPGTVVFMLLALGLFWLVKRGEAKPEAAG